MPAAASYTLPELAGAVNTWCERHEVAPLSGQASGELNERSIRYYRTLGLVDPPQNGGATSGYGELHFLQLLAIRLLQSQGQPLRRIQELLYGRSIAELREIRRRGMEERGKLRDRQEQRGFPFREQWQVFGLGEEFALLSRSGALPKREQLEAIREILKQPSERSSKQ